eukprot:scaffold107593_cov63-Phaeocystis_antarctica.AAC.1
MLLPQIVSPLNRLISCCLCFEYGTKTFDGSGSRLAVAWIAPAGSSWAGSAMTPARPNMLERGQGCLQPRCAATAVAKMGSTSREKACVGCDEGGGGKV